MEVMLMMVAASTGLSLLVPILIGYVVGSDRERTLLGLLLGAVAGLLLSWGVYVFGTMQIRGMIEDALTREASQATYEEIAEMKGRHCDVDAVIAKAMRDRILSEGDAIAIRAVAKPHAMSEARARLAGATAVEGCGTTPSTAKEDAS